MFLLSSSDIFRLSPFAARLEGKGTAMRGPPRIYENPRRLKQFFLIFAGDGSQPFRLILRTGTTGILLCLNGIQGDLPLKAYDRLTSADGSEKKDKYWMKGPSLSNVKIVLNNDQS